MSDSTNKTVKPVSNKTSALAQTLMLKTLEQLAERDKDEDLAQYVARQRIAMTAPWMDFAKELNELADDLSSGRATHLEGIDRFSRIRVAMDRSLGGLYRCPAMRVP